MFSEKTQLPTDNIMDRWILSFTQSLLHFVKEEMQGGIDQLSLRDWNKFLVIFGDGVFEEEIFGDGVFEDGIFGDGVFEDGMFWSLTFFHLSVPIVHGRTAPDQICRSPDELVRPIQPETTARRWGKGRLPESPGNAVHRSLHDDSNDGVTFRGLPVIPRVVCALHGIFFLTMFFLFRRRSLHF